MSNTVTKEAAMAKKQEACAEDLLRDLVTGKTGSAPAEGIPGVAIVYQSGVKRIHEARTTGPVEITPEREVLVDVELEAGGIVIPRVRFGYGPRTWRFPLPTDPLPKRKPRRPEARVIVAGDPPRFLGSPYDIHQTRAET
jgi:hypothetical protein